ncbi:MarR family winged helix-turn-helix transcriptional regulator [Macrococcus equipercicus]|uniref:HTH-type transcriptional regulator SarZ n=1 Tax=Macrococcus equipercicus TaxID=69967 RepID=A0A9Q9BNB3_9STAP|nr:MarR family transcriptional regulator [Macrococcus equipercicus]UTH14285.1 MarR family transcriptional regulator [Macrococcus equipercicus]
MTIETSVAYKMYLVQREVIKHYNRNKLKPYNISYQHYLVLMVLLESGPLPVLRLGEKLAFQSGTITPIIKKMELRGLIERARAQEDERIVHVLLTAEGRHLIEQLNHVPEEMLAVANLTPREFASLMHISRKIVNNMRYY